MQGGATSSEFCNIFLASVH